MPRTVLTACLFCFLVWLKLRSSRCKQYVCLERQSTVSELHGAVSQKIELFLTDNLKERKSVIFSTKLNKHREGIQAIFLSLARHMLYIIRRQNLSSQVCFWKVLKNHSTILDRRSDIRKSDVLNPTSDAGRKFNSESESKASRKETEHN
jgi:hypothetical protein